MLARLRITWSSIASPEVPVRNALAFGGLSTVASRWALLSVNPLIATFGLVLAGSLGLRPVYQGLTHRRQETRSRARATALTQGWDSHGVSLGPELQTFASTARLYLPLGPPVLGWVWSCFRSREYSGLYRTLFDGESTVLF